PPLGRLVAAIPKPIANAMLAGVLLKLCLAPFVALKVLPLQAAAILLTWLVFFRLARLYAVPAAMAVTLAILALTGEPVRIESAALWPATQIVSPVFTAEALFSIAIPLFVVTMASQNITGLAVLSTFGFRPNAREGLVATGLGSALIAPFGGPTVNYAAITAALCAGVDAHAEPARRYVAAVFSGVGYVALVALAGVAATVLTKASPLLVEAAAGLALMGAFGGAMLGATQDENSRIPAMITFLITASGFSFAGIGGAFWGLAIGWAADFALRARISA
ncbi:MAG TPA: benzoate/H(+) symporter BenE family transporter, partial [Beijerinckiaceae bacterium]|nr:benzoate/H(+) symporter BenE family transporter [Beijerinckiaceae bacterium]